MFKTQSSPSIATQLEDQYQWPTVHDLLANIDAYNLLLAETFHGPDIFNSRCTQNKFRFVSLATEWDINSFIESYLFEDMDNLFSGDENIDHSLPIASANTEAVLDPNVVNYTTQLFTETNHSCPNCPPVQQSCPESYPNAVDQMERLFTEQLITGDDAMIFDETLNLSTSLIVSAANGQPMGALSSLDTGLTTNQSVNYCHLYEPSTSLNTSKFTVDPNMMVSSNYGPNSINELNDLNKQSLSAMPYSTPVVNITDGNSVYDQNYGSTSASYQRMPADRKRHNSDKKERKGQMNTREKIEYLENMESELRLHQNSLVFDVKALEDEISRLKSALLKIGFNGEILNHYFNANNNQ